MKLTHKLLSLFALVTCASLFISKQNGQNKRYAGAPGDIVTTGCNDPANGCHHDAASSAGASVTLTGVPTSYKAGQVYPLTITVTDPTMVAAPGFTANAGFQVVAVNPALGANAGATNIGTFTATTGTKINTTSTASSNGPSRVIHSVQKPLANATWTFNWTAPAAGGPANVVFYYSVVVGDGDGNEAINAGPGDKAVWGNTANIPIGIELMSFNADIQKGNQVALAWKTATETDNKGFVIERKTDNSPFFQELGAVKGHGSTNTVHTYTFMDDAPESGKINYYRLRQEDFDGKTTYSKVVSVALKTSIKMKVYPSIVKNGDVLTVEMAGTSGNTVDLDVVNMNGQVIKIEKNIGYTEGVQFNVSNMASGRYIVKAHTGDKNNFASFVVN
jgi:hypothetical protein